MPTWQTAWHVRQCYVYVPYCSVILWCILLHLPVVFPPVSKIVFCDFLCGKTSMKCPCAVTSQGSGGPVLPSYATAPCLPPGEPPSSWSVWTQHERVFRGKGSQTAVERLEEFCLFIRNNSISGMRWWKMRSPCGRSGWNCSTSPSLFCIFSGIRCLVFWFGWLGWTCESEFVMVTSQSEEDHRILKWAQTPSRPTCVFLWCVDVKTVLYFLHCHLKLLFVSSKGSKFESFQMRLLRSDCSAVIHFAHSEAFTVD